MSRRTARTQPSLPVRPGPGPLAGVAGRVLAALGALLTAASATAQAPCELVLLEADELQGHGPVRALGGMTIDDAGRILATATVDGPSELDEFLLLDGVPVLAEGDAVRGLEGATHGGWRSSLGMGSRDLAGFPSEGGPTWVAELTASGRALGSQSLLHGSTPLVTTGDAFDGIGLGAGLRWRGLRSFVATDRGTLVIARLEDTAGGLRSALVRLEPDRRRPAVALLADGQRIPGAGRARLALLSEHPQALAATGDGHWLAAAALRPADDTAPAARVGALVLDGQLLLADGTSGPLAGTHWTGLEHAVVALDDVGRAAWIAGLVETPRTGFEGVARTRAAARLALVADGRLLARVGDRIGGAPRDLGPLVSFGADAPLRVGPGGRVLWLGRFAGRGEALEAVLFLGGRPLLREGESSVGGHVLDVLGESTESLALSPNGRWLALRARLPDGRDGVFRLDLGATETVRGCSAGAPSLRLRDGRPGGDTPLGLELVGDDADDYAAARLWVGTSWSSERDPCGIPTANGDLLLLHPRVLPAPGRVRARDRVTFEAAIPRELWPEDLVLQAAAVSRDGRIRLSTGLRLTPAAGRLPARTGLPGQPETARPLERHP